MKTRINLRFEVENSSLVLESEERRKVTKVNFIISLQRSICLDKESPCLKFYCLQGLYVLTQMGRFRKSNMPLCNVPLGESKL